MELLENWDKYDEGITPPPRTLLRYKIYFEQKIFEGGTCTLIIDAPGWWWYRFVLAWIDIWGLWWFVSAPKEGVGYEQSTPTLAMYVNVNVYVRMMSYWLPYCVASVLIGKKLGDIPLWT